MNIAAYEFNYTYRDMLIPYYVFFSVWDNDQNAALPVAHTASERIGFALDRKKINGRRQLEVIVRSELSYEEVADQFREALPDQAEDSGANRTSPRR